MKPHLLGFGYPNMACHHINNLLELQYLIQQAFTFPLQCQQFIGDFLQ